jgi:predicted nucleic acid-binding protein
MNTALDTNVLLDVLVPGSPHGNESQQALDAAVATSGLVISEPVYAELAARFVHARDLDVFLVNTRVQLEPSTRATLHEAGRACSDYSRRRPTAIECPDCGAQQPERCIRRGGRIQARQRVLADFIIGAHALLQADRLLTRDRRYYRTYFPSLRIG